MFHQMSTYTGPAYGAIAITLLATSGLARPSDTRSQDTNAMASLCPVSIPLANLVSESDLIVVATPDPPTSRLRSAMQEESSNYIDVPLLEPSFLKGGEASTNLLLKAYPKQTKYTPSPAALLDRAGKPSLLFLSRVDEGPIGIYFTDSLDALQGASAVSVDAVKAEVRRQQAVVRKSASNTTPPHYDEVRDLLSALPRATPDGQAAIFQKLEAFGTEGVPAIVALMDDRRPLALQYIALVNHSPNAFEGLRQYGPKLVVDALDAILNQVTGFGGSIVNGGSERERQSAVAAWKVYAADMKCE